MLIPLILLSIGAIFAGVILKKFLLEMMNQTTFGKIRYFFKSLSTEHPPFWFLILTPILVIISIPIAYYLFLKNKNLPEQIC